MGRPSAALLWSALVTTPPAAYGLTWERHYAALSTYVRADMTGWWITGYDPEGFPQASIHIQDVQTPTGEDITETLAAQILDTLQPAANGEAP